ncbi:MAG: hypothetical protein N2442_06715 [Spirochaetes bacterium]|nr:hypothetical protein [Spirochaetota bacterium]
MELDSMVLLLSRLFIGGGASFCAILLWTKTRDTGWMLVGLGVIAGYVETIYTTLKSFGVIPSLLVVKNISLLEVLLVNLPFLFIMIGLIVTISHRSPR